MSGEERRKRMVDLLQSSQNPLSGGKLAAYFDVSRQVIVQDIALLRAVNKNILATNKGYIIHKMKSGEKRYNRIFGLKHTDEEILDELYTIVDLGGKVLDVVVEHDIYGQITVDLIIKNRKDAKEFADKTRIAKVRPLKELTDGIHFHTVEGESEEALEEIAKALDKKGYLIKE